MPGFVDPCLASLREAPPAGANWIHEIKYDGYRVQAHCEGKDVTLFTRRGYDWTNRFGALPAELAKLPVRSAIFDGEVIAADANGRPDFALLQEALASGKGKGLLYYIFDLLFLDGFDLRGATQIARKELLRELMGGNGHGPLLYSEHMETGGESMFQSACAMGLEGIVSKRRDARYASDRGENWIKVKCQKRGHYQIIAFVEKLGAKPRRIASFYIGRQEKGRLLYAGKVQTGFTEKQMRDLRELLEPHIRASSPLDVPVKKPKATWVEPVIEAEIQYSSLTSEGLLREPVYISVRRDLSAGEPSARMPAKAPNDRPHIGVPRENILQLLPDAVAPSKEELAAYWKKVGERALAHLGGRPLKLVRHAHRTIFYHKGKLPPVPYSVHQIKIEKREGGEGTRLWIDSVEGLLGLVEMGAVELHPWNARVEDLEHPDLVVFDLDPGDGVAWEFVTDTALALRDLLKREDLDSWPKLSGGKGMHLMVPVEPMLTHDEARDYAKSLAQRLAGIDRARYILSSAPKLRAGKIFIDYLRNGRGNTAVGAYSPRVRDGFPVAAPITWKQVEKGTRPEAFTRNKPPRG